MLYNTITSVIYRCILLYYFILSVDTNSTKIDKAGHKLRIKISKQKSSKSGLV